MKEALKIYGELLRLVRRLPKDSRPYYAKYVRENFVNYREVEVNDDQALRELFNRAYVHSLWILNKYSVDQSAADKLKKMCGKKWIKLSEYNLLRSLWRLPKDKRPYNAKYVENFVNYGEVGWQKDAIALHKLFDMVCNYYVWNSAVLLRAIYEAQHDS